ncbi:hypothetical protein D3C85_1624980 [compost metagenome]
MVTSDSYVKLSAVVVDRLKKLPPDVSSIPYVLFDTVPVSPDVAKPLRFVIT